MSDFRDLILSQRGKRICVMGGADTLQSDLERVDADVYISTNGHGSERADYVLAMDSKHGPTMGNMGEYLRSLTGAPIISPHGYADYHLTQWPQHPRFVLSGMVAAWAAFVMGARAVILAGMDGYRKPGYIDEAKKMARDIHCPVRAMSDEMAKVWPRYNTQERYGRYKAHASINRWQGMDGRIDVRVLKPTTIHNRAVMPGEVLSVMSHEVARLIKHKMVVEA